MAKATSKLTAALGRVVTDRLGEAVRGYVVGEVMAPLRHLGRRLVLGLAGSVLIAVGAVIALVGMLRALQTETGRAFAGHWSFAPYLITAAAAAVALGGFTVFGFRAVLRTPGGRKRRTSRRA